MIDTPEFDMAKKVKLTWKEKRELRKLERGSRELRLAEAERWGREDGADMQKSLADNPYLDAWPWDFRRRAWNREFLTVRVAILRG